MKTLDKIFSRKGIQYETLDRTDKAGFFKLTLDGEHVGFEVSRINYHKSFDIAGRTVEEGESIVGDEAFGLDGSSAFFPHEKDRAFDYFQKFDAEITAKLAEITHT